MMIFKSCIIRSTDKLVCPVSSSVGKLAHFNFCFFEIEKWACINWKPIREKYQNYKDDIAEAENRLENHQRDRVRIGEAKLRTALAGMDFLPKG